MINTNLRRKRMPKIEIVVKRIGVYALQRVYKRLWEGIDRFPYLICC